MIVWFTLRHVKTLNFVKVSTGWDGNLLSTAYLLHHTCLKVKHNPKTYIVKKINSSIIQYFKNKNELNLKIQF